MRYETKLISIHLYHSYAYCYFPFRILEIPSGANSSSRSYNIPKTDRLSFATNLLAILRDSSMPALRLAYPFCNASATVLRRLCD